MQFIARTSRLIALGNTWVTRSIEPGLYVPGVPRNSNMIRRLIILTDTIPMGIEEVWPSGGLAEKADEEGVEIIAVDMSRGKGIQQGGARSNSGEPPRGYGKC